DRADRPPAGETLQDGRGERERAHVRGLLLDPDDLPGLRERLERRGELRGRERRELFEGEDRRAGVAALVPLAPELVGDLARADQDAIGAGGGFRDDAPEFAELELVERRGRRRMAQERLR